MVSETTQFAGSSHLAEASYDVDTSELVLTFRSGDSYRYSNVPQATYSGLQRAGSAGQFFHRHISGRFSYTQE